MRGQRERGGGKGGGCSWGKSCYDSCVAKSNCDVLLYLEIVGVLLWLEIVDARRAVRVTDGGYDGLEVGGFGSCVVTLDCY